MNKKTVDTVYNGYLLLSSLKAELICQANGLGMPDDILVYSALPALLWVEEQYQFVGPDQCNMF